jgi:RNA polymerase sigma-70 factor (ECF subfamily)
MERIRSESAAEIPLVDCIIVAARSGDPVAIDTVIIHTYPLVQRFLRYLADELSVADDLTQEVMLNAARHLPALENHASLMPWLYQMARNAWRSYGRRHSGRMTASLEQWMKHTSVHRDFAEQVSAIEQVEDAIVVQQLLSGLSDEQRELIYLRHIVGFTAAEIGVVLGISHAAARQRIHRAETAIRQHDRDMRVHTVVLSDHRETANDTA